MTAVTGDRIGHVVRADVANVTACHANLGAILLMAIKARIFFGMAHQAGSHGAELLARGRVKTVTYRPMAITAMNLARIAMLHPIRNDRMRDAQPVLDKVRGEIIVTDEALLWLFLSQVGDEALVGGLFVFRIAITPVARHTTQHPMGLCHR
jgi:hypothetical protein